MAKNSEEEDSARPSRGTTQLSSFLQHLDEYVALFLSDQLFTEENKKELSDAIKKSKNLSVISFTNCSLEDDDIELILDFFCNENIGYESHLSSLELQENRLSDNGIKYIIKLLKYNENLTSVNLTGNAISDQGINDIAQFLCDETIGISLYLSKNSISELAINKLTDSCSRRHNLYLDNDKIESIQHYQPEDFSYDSGCLGDDEEFPYDYFGNNSMQAS